MYKELLAGKDLRPKLFDYDLKSLQSNQVRVKSIFGAPKHGTELTELTANLFMDHYYDDDRRILLKREVVQTPEHVRLGNIWVGEITEFGGDVRGFEIGQRVAGYGNLATTHDVKEGDLLVMPEAMKWQEAVYYDPMQFALGGIRDAQVRLGDKVLVSGLGAIGQMAAQGAKLSGASLVAVSDPIEKRRKAALENGADLAFDPTTEDFGWILREHTGGVGMDAVIETSGNYLAIEQGLRALGYFGNMALVGWFKECKVPIHLGREGHFNQSNVFFSRACSEPNRDYPRWDFTRICREAWNLLTSGKVKCENIIDPVVDFNECDTAYARYIIDNPDESIKMGVRF